MKDQMIKMNNLLDKLLAKQRNDDPNSESDDIINKLQEDNVKMADKIKTLQTVVEETIKENAQIKTILGIKQNEWLKIENNKRLTSESTVRDESIRLETSNRYASLEVEEIELSSQTQMSHEPDTSNNLIPGNRNGESNECFSTQLNNYRET